MSNNQKTTTSGAEVKTQKNDKTAKTKRQGSTEGVPKGSRRCSICLKVSKLEDFEKDARTKDLRGPRHTACRSKRFAELNAAKRIHAKVFGKKGAKVAKAKATTS